MAKKVLELNVDFKEKSKLGDNGSFSLQVRQTGLNDNGLTTDNILEQFDGCNFERESVEKVFFGLGSNLGDRACYLQQAREALTDLPLQEFQASSVYESLPLANMDQPLYLNQVVCGQTTLGPETLLETCLQIEKRLGRIRWEHWGSRIIDIDLFVCVFV